MNIGEEFDRQVQNLVQKGYTQAANLSTEKFISLLKPLKQQLSTLSLPPVDIEKGYLPFVIVITPTLISTEVAMSLIEKDGKSGITKLFPLEPNDFTTLEAIQIPVGSAYLLIDVDRGKETINLPPSDAMKIILKENRLPITIDEGVAIVTQFPKYLLKNNCFSLLASRHSGDKRVPAIWINASKNPNLGWCWDGNPHTWLGSASCKGRIGVLSDKFTKLNSGYQLLSANEIVN